VQCPGGGAGHGVNPPYPTRSPFQESFLPLGHCAGCLPAMSGLHRTCLVWPCPPAMSLCPPVVSLCPPAMSLCPPAVSLCPPVVVPTCHVVVPTCRVVVQAGPVKHFTDVKTLGVKRRGVRFLHLHSLGLFPAPTTPAGRFCIPSGSPPRSFPCWGRAPLVAWPWARLRHRLPVNQVSSRWCLLCDPV
jgi:hypothetical protein